MKRRLRLTNMTGWDEREYILRCIPELKSQFRQRKQYEEYYFDEADVELTIEQIEMLSETFNLEINCQEVIIIINY